VCGGSERPFKRTVFPDHAVFVPTHMSTPTSTIRRALGLLSNTSAQSNIESPAPTYAQKVIWSAGGSRSVVSEEMLAPTAVAIPSAADVLADPPARRKHNKGAKLSKAEREARREARREAEVEVEAFGEVGVLQAERGPAPRTTTIFGKTGVLQVGWRPHSACRPCHQMIPIPPSALATRHLAHLLLT
jgi:hypothetical protein